MGALLELSVQSCNERIIWDFYPLLVLSCYLNPPATETQRQLLLLLGTFTRCRGLWGYVLIVCCGFLPDSPPWVLLLTERLVGIADGIHVCRLVRGQTGTYEWLNSEMQQVVINEVCSISFRVAKSKPQHYFYCFFHSFSLCTLSDVGIFTATDLHAKRDLSWVFISLLLQSDDLYSSKKYLDY